VAERVSSEEQRRHVLQLFDDLLDAGDRDMHRWHGGAHPPVAFVLDQAQGAGLGHGEVDAGQADLRFLVLIDLNDVLAEIGLDGLYADRAEVVVEMNLLGDHALRFHDFFGTGLLKNIRYGATGVVGGGGIMHMRSLAFQALLRLFEIGVEVLDRVLANLAGEAAEIVGRGVIGAQDGVALLGAGRAVAADGFLDAPVEAAGEEFDFLFSHDDGGRIEGFERNGGFSQAGRHGRRGHRGA